jgi:CelD/BcsL family acetyltransferase involved in cellulose biosynthesis
MKVKVFNNNSQLLEIKEDWNKLFNEGSYSVFQSFDFCYESSLEKNLFIICLIDGADIIELWPCEIINRKLRFINDAHADFCDIITSSKSNAVVDYLNDLNLLGSLRFINLKTDSLVKNKLSKVIFYDLRKSINYSVLSLTKTEAFPANFNHFVYRQKRRLKRILNKYSTNHVLYTSSDSKFPLDEIINLKNKMISIKSRGNEFLDKSFLRFSERLFNSGKLIVSKIELEGEIVAISLLFKSDNYYSFWIDLYTDLKMINLYHNTLFIKNITEFSDATFNFGRGAYNYKTQNFSPDVYVLEEFSTFNSSLEKKYFQFSKWLLSEVREIYKKIK